jgi:hypothetical protein
MSESEFEFEPIPGLPAELPAGETLLWQGSPGWAVTARRVFRVWGFGYYFAALLLWRAVTGWYAGQPAAQIEISMAWLAALGVAIIGFLLLVAYMVAQGTIYTVTTRRVVMRYGIVFPMSLNIPYNIVESAGLREYLDGTGDIPLRLKGNGRIAYPHLWPHARPWAINQPEPMLRGVAGAQAAARVLGNALYEYNGGQHHERAVRKAIPPRRAGGRRHDGGIGLDPRNIGPDHGRGYQLDAALTSYDRPRSSLR